MDEQVGLSQSDRKRLKTGLLVMRLILPVYNAFSQTALVFSDIAQLICCPQVQILVYQSIHGLLIL